MPTITKGVANRRYRALLLVLCVAVVPVIVLITAPFQGDGTPASSSDDRQQLERKKACEMKYWRERKQEEGVLSQGSYTKLYEAGLGNLSVVAGRKLLDIGCGPRGSLEWADQAAARVCADPLAHEYQQLDAPSRHSMVYVSAGVEEMPFIAESFDLVTSINNFDHVSDPRKGAAEIARVLKRGGRFLLIVRVHEHPTECEPQTLGWSVSSMFTRHGLRLLRQRATANVGAHKGTSAIFNDVVDPASAHEGMLLALFEKP